MAVADAVVARGMATRVERAMPGIKESFSRQSVLLWLAKQKGNIKYGLSGTNFEWYIRKDSSSAPSWGGGELGTRTFEEIDPASKCYLPFCYIEQGYGVGERTLETGKNASGYRKIYDSLKENLEVAKIGLWDAVLPTVYTGGASGVKAGNGGDQPIGIEKAAGDCYLSSEDIVVTAGQCYANQTLNTDVIGTGPSVESDWDSKYYYPVCTSLNEIPGVSSDAGALWLTDCLVALSYMASVMERSANVTGTGKPTKPDLAIMDAARFLVVKGKIISAQGVGYQIPLGRKDVILGGFSSFTVDTLEVVKDTDIGTDSGGGIRVFCLDSNEFKVYTTHRKSEGLIISAFDAKNPAVSGAIGVLRMNLGWAIMPTAIGCIVGTDDSA